ncbi:MAG: ribosome hibernation-promoting factor, HPF/YfiA family [Patescibacteria group bacterium]
MEIRYFCKNLTIDGKTLEYIEKRLTRVSRVLDRIIRIELEAELDKKGFYRLEVMIKVPRKLYRAEETSESLESSVDTVVDELLSQIRKDKDRVREVRERGARSIKKKMSLDKNSRFRK